MRKGNTFGALLSADPDAPPPSSPKKERQAKPGGFRHGVVCGTWHYGQILLLLHRHGDARNWNLALLTDKILDEVAGKLQAQNLLMSSLPGLPPLQLLDGAPLKEGGTVRRCCNMSGMCFHCH